MRDFFAGVGFTLAVIGGYVSVVLAIVLILQYVLA
jgi:hypothetical protein